MPVIHPYETRLCAFVDILGFRNLIEESAKRPDLAQQIRRILWDVRDATPLWERDPPVDILAAGFVAAGIDSSEATVKAQEHVSRNSKKERGTTFSDSLVLSSILEERAVRNLVISLILLSQNVAKFGYYVRGGVCVGPLCHETDICFGPALVSAYDLEKAGQYPRIVFDAEARRALDTANASGSLKLGFYLRQGGDGMTFLHFLGQAALHLLPEFSREHISEIHWFLSRGLNSAVSKDARVKCKLFWLAKYFNSCLDETKFDGMARFDMEEVAKKLNL